MQQAANKKDRFKPVLHKKLRVNDVVLLTEDNIKHINFPLGEVQEVNHNDLGEVTPAKFKKAKSGQLLKRHVSSLIPLLSDTNVNRIIIIKLDTNIKTNRKSRAAAIASKNKTKSLYDSELC